MTLTHKMLPQGGRPDVIPINASGLKISACMRRWYMTVVMGLKRKDEDDTSLKLGKLCHKHIEMVLLNKTPEGMAQAMITTNEAAKTLPTIKTQDTARSFIAAASASRFSTPILIDGKPAVEVKFQFPINEMFSYTGTMDLISHDTSRNVLVIEDHKTSRKYRFDEIIASYEGDTQFTFYSFIVQKFAYEIFKKDLDTANLAWYRKFFIRANVIMLSTTPIAIRRGPEWSFSEQMMKRFEEELENFILTAQDFINDKELPPPVGMTCNACPACPFKALCFASNSSAYENALQDYIVEKYEPLKW